MIGWIKLHRKSYDNFLYKTNKPHTRREAWEDMLMLVNFEDSPVLFGNEVIECKRGQSLRSLESWGKVFNWEKTKVKRFFQLLNKMQMIVTENVHKTTRITICKYEDYQGDRNPNATQTQPECNSNATQTQPIKEEEETNKKKKLIKDKIKKIDAAKAATLKRRKEFHDSLIPFVSIYSKEMITEFYNYWAELNKSKTKMKFELNKTWELTRRLTTWSNNNSKFSKNGTKQNSKSNSNSNSNVSPEFKKRILATLLGTGGNEGMSED